MFLTLACQPGNFSALSVPAITMEAAGKDVGAMLGGWVFPNPTHRHPIETNQVKPLLPQS